MGYGSFLTINNQASVPVKSFVQQQTCMYDKGHSGSNLDYFNDLTISAGGSTPRKYIEAKASGDCAFSNSSFTIRIMKGDSHFDMKFTDVSNHHWTTPDGCSWIQVYVNNSGKQGDLAITILN